MTDSVPEKLGKYKIIEEVGRGGFAAVYKAVDTTLDRTVALKCLAPHLLWDPTFVQRFQREAKVAANLDHSNIVTIYEVGQIEGVYFIAMQFLEGQTLSQILGAEERMPVSRVQAIIEQIASALDYAHARDFVHRDIKPSNIIVSDDGRATLTDFGLVKAGEGTKLSTTGVVFGTPEYMSPEQAEGKVLDARSDVYSLGVVLFEMLAGQAPFVADTTPAVMYKHVHEPPPLDELPSDLPQDVVAVVEKALAKKREERYQSAGEMAAALQQAVSRAVMEEAEAPPPVAAPPVPPAAVAKEEYKLPTPKVAPKKALGRGVLLAGGLVLLAIVGIVIFAISRWPSKPTPEPPTGAPVVQVTTPAPTAVPIATPIPPTDRPVPPTSTPVSPTPTYTPLPPTAAPAPPTDTPTPSVPPDMVYVPAGEFTMGSDEGDSSEQPVHTVYLDAFYIDKTEVTNAQFAQFLNEKGNQEEGGVPWLDIGNEYCLITERGGQYQPKSGYSDHPVIEVSWYGADAYCRWADKRLPTEAEWEKAARGTDGRKYPWGDAFDGSRVNFCDRNCEADWKDTGADDGHPRTAPVKSYPAGDSPYEALDMAGNVWEWVADWYDYSYYVNSPGSDPNGPPSGEKRVLRGGSWADDETRVRAAYRGGEPPVVAKDIVGFRCAR